MNRDNYKQRLAAFNETEKYKSERDFALRLLNPQKDERILDYGTGLGRMVYYLNEHFGCSAYGYDVHNFREKDDSFLFRREFFFKFQKVLFMHSLAHVENIESRLCYLRDNMEHGGQVLVITPNNDWLRMIETARQYVADPTLIAHFTSTELKNLFVGCGFKVTNSGQFGAIKNGQHERLFLQATI